MVDLPPWGNGFPTKAELARSMDNLPKPARDLMADLHCRGYTAQDVALMHGTTARKVAYVSREAQSMLVQTAQYRAAVAGQARRRST